MTWEPETHCRSYDIEGRDSCSDVAYAGTRSILRSAKAPVHTGMRNLLSINGLNTSSSRSICTSDGRTSESITDFGCGLRIGNSILRCD